eukprot:TRINITY_DN16297_c0_g1_i1.p1 TRINITY_DN16297_c0_g1~~TRINITY_DN16297_c0_g1_i1.p1  ORF type:complete len:715 (-),score=193.61 TRINITY_DN16297_c0_g1_i1:55-2199(-)
MEPIYTELWVRIFGFLDGPRHKTVASSCKLWHKLVNTEDIWKKMVASLRSSLSALEEECLPNEHKLAFANRNKAKDPLKVLKNTYKILATCLIVHQSDKYDEVKKAFEASRIKMRKDRVFATVAEALQKVDKGGYIFINVTGSTGEDIVIDKKVNIFGESTFNRHATLSTDWQGGMEWTEQAKGSRMWDLVIRESELYIPTTVSIERSIFILNSTLVLANGGYAKMSGCSFLPSATVDFAEEFQSISMKHSSIEDIEDAAITTIYERLQKALAANDLVRIDDYLKTLGCIAFTEDGDRLQFLIDSELIACLDKILPVYYSNTDILISIFYVLESLLKTKFLPIAIELEKYTFLEKLKEIIDLHKTNTDLLVTISSILWNLADFPRCRALYKRKPDIFESVVNMLDQNCDNELVCQAYLETLWHCSHHVQECGIPVLNGINVILKLLEKNSGNEKILVDGCGMFWNLPAEWTQEATAPTLPIAIKALKVVKDDNDIGIILGFIIKLIKTCTDSDVQYLVDNNTITLLLELKNSHPTLGLDQINTILSWLAKNKEGRRILCQRVSKRSRYLGIGEIERVKILRTLSIQDEADPEIFKVIGKILKKTEDYRVFYYAMDALVHLMINDKLVDYRPSILDLGKILFSRANQFTKIPQVERWIGWADCHLRGAEKRNSGVYMDPLKTVGWQISKDGLTVRHDFNSLFGSSVANVYVTKGL